MLNINNYRAGHYNYTDGKYTSYAGRICLNDYVDVIKDTSFKANITGPTYKILVREMDANGKFIKTVILSNTSIYTPSENATKLGLSIYNAANSNISMEDYKEMFASGFEARLSINI